MSKNMKGTRIIILAAVAILAAGCAKSEKAVNEPQTIEIRATHAENGKTVLGEDGVTVYWNSRDAINLFYGNSYPTTLYSVNKEPEIETIFIGSVIHGYGESGSANKKDIWAVYPAQNDQSCDGESVTLTVPTKQTAKAGSFADKMFPSVGKSKTTDIAFYNVCGGLRFSLVNEGIKSVVLQSVNSEPLAGKCKVAFEENAPVVKEITDGQSSISLTAPDGGTFETGKWYYISIIPGVVNGLRATFYTEGGYADKTVAGEVEVKRSIFGSIEEMDKGTSFKTRVQINGVLDITECSAAVSGVIDLGHIASVDKEVRIIYSDKEDVLRYGMSAKADLYDNGTFDCALSSLKSNTKYYCVAKLTAGAETIYSAVKEFTTKDFTAAIVATASEVKSTSATISGSLSVSSVASLEKSVDIYCSLEESTVEGLKSKGKKVTATLSSDGSFTAECANLSGGEKYWFIAVAKVYDKEFNSTVMSFTTVYIQPEIVDLGLNVKWASFNLGASKPEEYGGYYQWAGTKDVTDRSIYLDWSNCPYHTGSDASTGWTKYVPSNKSSYWSGFGSPDNKRVLDPDDDVAHVKLGGKWRMPTYAEWGELINNCTSEWTTLNGVKGRLFTSKKNGNSIFLPAAGYRSNDSLGSAGSYGYYWSSSLSTGDPDSAYYVYFSSGSVGRSGYDRYDGRSVRPVSD